MACEIAEMSRNVYISVCSLNKPVDFEFERILRVVLCGLM